MKRIGKNETTEINTVKKCFVGLAAMQRSSDISQLTETDRFALAEIMAALNVL